MNYTNDDNNNINYTNTNISNNNTTIPNVNKKKTNSNNNSSEISLWTDDDEEKVPQIAQTARSLIEQRNDFPRYARKKRVDWAAFETRALYSGMKYYGTNWTAILNNNPGVFNTTRRPVDLHNKYKNDKKKQERYKARLRVRRVMPTKYYSF